MVAGSRTGKKAGQPYVVFVVNNLVSGTAVATAASLARAGRDTLELVTFVSSEAQRGGAEEVLAGHRRTALRSMAEVKTTCVVRELLHAASLSA